MRNNISLYIILLALSIFSCTKGDFTRDDSKSQNPKYKSAITKSSYDLVNCSARYYPEYGRWLIEQDDPFRLENYQSRFDDVSRTLGYSRLVGRKLVATHYALTVMPGTFEEQEALENDPDLDVSYVPFGYVLAPPPVSLPKAVRQESATEELECEYGEDSPVVQPTTLYIIWPVSKDIPASLSYQKQYEVFLPSSTELTESEREVTEYIRIFGDESNLRTPPILPPIPEGIVTIKVYDNFLSSYVPLKNAKVKAVYGSATQYYTTNSLGKVFLSRMYGDHATCYYLLEQNKFSVRDSTTSAIVQRSLGYVQIGDMSTPLYQNTYYTFNLSEDLPEIVYNAADYLFNEDTLAAPDIVNIPAINIFLYHSLSSLGQYDPGGRFINIKDANANQRNYVIGTTLHELGHYYQHYNWGYDDSSVAPILIESFASAFGYYLGEQYYLSKGYVKPSSSFHINKQHRQTWRYTYTPSDDYNIYSPIYVDLIDDHNQYDPSNHYPNDTISDVPFSIILRMGKEAETLEDVEDILDDEIVPPYTLSNISSQMWYYYYWRSNQ